MVAAQRPLLRRMSVHSKACVLVLLQEPLPEDFYIVREGQLASQYE